MDWPTWLPKPPALDQLVSELVEVVEVPAPPFGEERRARLFRDLLHSDGLPAEQDAVGNVIVRLGPKDGQALALFAHIDTALDLGEITVRRDAGRVYAHGAADDGAGLTVLRALARLVAESGRTLPRPVYFVADVGEEGLGDLRGARRFTDDHHQELCGVLVLDGRLGDIVHTGIASRRLEVSYDTQGGHSWSDFGRPSAVHQLSRSVADLTRIRLPASPRTTLNVGVIGGGTAVNAIAQKASCLVDLRSESQEELDRLEARARDLLSGPFEGVQVQIRKVGDRPGGAIARSHPLVRLSARNLSRIGLAASYAAGSTDANAPLAHGIPAVCCGVGRGGSAHTPSEWLEEESLSAGLNFSACLLSDLLDESDL